MLKEKIRSELLSYINESSAEPIDESLIQLEQPRQKSHGDFATNIAFKCAKLFKKAPAQIAEDLCQTINEKYANSANFKLDALNGFINIKIKDESLITFIKNYLKQKPNYPSLGKQINLEFLSANPTGPLHIGHGRWAVLGDALQSLFSFTGQNSDTENYINDAGVQIKNLLASIEAVQNGQAIPEDGYHGGYIKELAESDEDPVKLMLNQHKESLERLNIQFDTWFSEKSLYDNQEVQSVLDFLSEHKHSYEKDGATWFKSTEYGDDKDRVLIKSDGNYTYFLVDIAYHFNKIKRGYTNILNIWGADHHGYVPRMAAAIKALCTNNENVEFTVLIGQLVNLFRDGEPVRMSKRSGDIITLDEVVDEIGADALRYFLLEKNSDTTIDFDLNLAVQKNSENPVFYVQYAHARMCSLLSKIDPSDAEPNKTLESQERQLLLHCLHFYDEVWEATKHFAPFKLITYAYSLAKNFHNFYEHCSIQNASEDQQVKRLALVRLTRDVLAKSFRLLGISSPERM